MWSTPCARATSTVRSVEPSSITSHSTTSKPGTSRGSSASATGRVFSSSLQGTWMMSFMGTAPGRYNGPRPAPLGGGIGGKGGDVDFVRVTTLFATDQAFLERAITLAGGGRGRVSPNPLVGAVVVKDGTVLGEGFHARYGEAHAEREALAACGAADTRGATLYVSLEPCCHHGRTPPCTDAILAAGIARAVVAADAPTEKAAGRGLGILRDEGVEVVVAEGESAAAARLLNQPFRKHARTGRPHVRFKAAMTLDGKVATRTGDSKWISCEESRRLAHRWRAESDAVAGRIGTAPPHDPPLTPRVDGGTRQPRRVVFDSEGRLPLDSKLVRGTAEVPLTVVVSRAASRLRTDALEAAGADVVVATGANEPAR